MSALDRRRFIGALLAAAGSVTLVGCVEPPARARPRPRPDGDPVVDYFRADEIAAARALGLAWIAAGGPDPGEADRLLESLAELAASDGVGEAARALEQAVQADFRSLQLVDLAGWTVGRTELLLCVALAEES